MIKGSLKKINPPTGLPFAPSSALRKRLHSTAMRPFTRLEVAPYFKATPKSSAFWGIYFLPQPKKCSSTGSFTLIEIIVVLVIISISSVILIPRITTGFELAKFRKTSTEVIGFLRKAHLDAIEGRKDIDVTVDFKENTLIRDDGQLYPLPPEIILKTEGPDDHNTAAFSFFYNGRGAGPEIQLIGRNERMATIHVDLLSGLAKCEF